MTPRCHSVQRIFELRTLHAPAVSAHGRLRPARAGEVDLLTRWTDGFFAAVNEAADSRRLVVSRVKVESLFVWDHNGAVSMAAATGRTRRTARVAHVYTPPEHRGHGYATACVAALTRRLLDEGTERCCLYADVANPASNAIYQKLGYAPVCEVTKFVLEK